MELKISNKTIFRILLMSALFVFGAYLTMLLHRELTWIGISVFLALAMEPAVQRLAKYLPGKGRGMATAIVILFTLGLLSFVTITLAPPTIAQTNSLLHDLPGYFEKLQHQGGLVGDLVNKYGTVDYLKEVQNHFPGSASKVGGEVFGVLRSVFDSVIAIVTIATLTFFMITEGPMMMAAFWRYQPVKVRKHRQEVASQMHKAVTGYVNGRLLLALVTTASTLLVLLILGLPYALPLSILVGLISILPLIGATLAGIIMVLMALLYGNPTKALVVVAFFAIYQQVENHVLQPIVFRRTIDTPGTVVLIAAIFGAVLSGLVGALVAIPVAACIQILVKDYLENHRGVEA